MKKHQSLNLSRRPRRFYPVWTFLIISGFWLLSKCLHSPPPRDPTYGLLPVAKPKNSKYAIATFLSGGSLSSDEKSKDEYDNYYHGARVLAYQLLHANATRSSTPIPFLVLVTSNVSQRKRQQLTLDGATVVEVADVPLRWWIKTGVTRWADQFTKLRIFQMVQYDRVLFVDADTLLTGPLDGIFVTPEARTPKPTLFDARPKEVKADEMPLPVEYIFAARSDNALAGERDHPFLPNKTSVFSAGFWIAAPSNAMFDYLMSVMGHYRRFNPHTMEQSLLNYAFRREGTMPWLELEYNWSATWPSEKDVKGGVVSLHEKFWATGPEKLRGMWHEMKAEMERFHSTGGGKKAHR